MNAYSRLLDVIANANGTHAMWAATAVAFSLLMLALYLQSRRHASALERLSATDMPGAGHTIDTRPVAVFREASNTGLDGVSISPIDRIFPRRPRAFLSMVALVSAGCWLAGLLLAPDIRRFLTSSEWLFQPLYLAAHFITLRLFINVFTHNFAAGVVHLKVSRIDALRGVRGFLGGPGAIVAALIAAPFCYFDFHYLFSPRYAKMGGDDALRAIDYLVWGIWCLEWFLNAFIWVVLIGFLVKNCWTIHAYPFRAPIHVVLHEKHYRPFLQMSAQGATMVLAFSAFTVFYLWYTGGELTDYLGLAITGTLLVIGFVPPWMLLKSKVDRAVMAEKISLRERLTEGGLLDYSTQGPADGSTSDVRAHALEQRLDEALALLRISHLENLYGNLGQTEAKAIMIRLMAPALTIGWQVSQNLTDLMQKLERFAQTLLGRI